MQYNENFTLIAKTFQGLEEILAKELTTLGAENVEIGKRMVSFTADKHDVPCQLLTAYSSTHSQAY